MKTRAVLGVGLSAMLVCGAWVRIGAAATNYVDAACTNPVPPYTSWGTAAKALPAALGVAAAGNTVLVTNGVYVVSNQVFVTNGVVLRSVNGAAATTVKGAYPASTNRCFYLGGSNSVIDGFTITNGWAVGDDWPDNTGGGVFVAGPGGVVQNSVLSGNSAGSGGGLTLDAAATVRDCIIEGNRADWAGGGVLTETNGILQN